MTFWAEVEAQIERNSDKDGWQQGPESICREMAEEAVDIPSWMRGLDQYPMTAEQLQLVDEIKTESSLLWLKIGRLGATYRT